MPPSISMSVWTPFSAMSLAMRSIFGNCLTSILWPLKPGFTVSIRRVLSLPSLLSAHLGSSVSGFSARPISLL